MLEMLRRAFLTGLGSAAATAALPAQALAVDPVEQRLREMLAAVRDYVENHDNWLIDRDRCLYLNYTGAHVSGITDPAYYHEAEAFHDIGSGHTTIDPGHSHSMPTPFYPMLPDVWKLNEHLGKLFAEAAFSSHYHVPYRGEKQQTTVLCVAVYDESISPFRMEMIGSREYRVRYPGVKLGEIHVHCPEDTEHPRYTAYRKISAAAAEGRDTFGGLQRLI